MNYQSVWSKAFSIHWFIYLLLAIMFVSLGVQDLRQNNERMGELKMAVIAADESGEGVNQALKSLSQFVFTHMNTTTQVTLASEYSRDAQAAIEAAQPDETSDEVYNQAREECENPNIPLTARASCVAEYVSANSPDPESTEVDLPVESTYKYSFVAPVWSADLAGLSLLTSVVLIGLALSSWLRSD